ncbi:MAG: hypothetical protein KAJ10_02460 [Thermodesulfovibrionia bacterium]|nr:hypothetical protein [Thermodesulfovibrionia bacterium]
MRVEYDKDGHILLTPETQKEDEDLAAYIKKHWSCAIWIRNMGRFVLENTQNYSTTKKEH